jgi:hypothetical protein
MAGNKKRIGLDQPAGDTLGKIDDLLAWLVESEQDNYVKADEFTVDMAAKKMQTAGLQVSDAALRCKLCRMAKSGQLTSRLIRLNGKMTSVYKRVTV